MDSDDPKVQEILTTLDDTLSPEFVDNLETIYGLIQNLPDKPTETPKIGFRQDMSEKKQNIYNNKILKEVFKIRSGITK